MTQLCKLNWKHAAAGLTLAFAAAIFVSAASLDDVSVQAAQKKGKKKKGKKDKGKPKPPPPVKKIPKDKTPPLFALKGHKYWVYSMGLSSNGKYLVTSSRDKTIKLWDLAAKKELRTFEDYKRDVKRLAVISPDGKHVVTTTWKVTVKKVKVKDKKTKKEMEKTVRTFGGEIKVWDAATGKEIKSIPGHSSMIESLAISPDGKRIVTGSADDTAIVWVIASGKMLHTLKGHKGTVFAVAYSLDGSKIATGSSDKTVKIWDANSGKEVKALKGPGRDVTSIVFRPGDKQIAAGSLDAKIYVWDVASGKEVRKLEAPEGIWGVAFSNNGKFLAGTGFNDTVKVWNADTGKELFYRNGHKGSVLNVVFTPDNSKMLTAGVDQTINVWAVPK